MNALSIIGDDPNGVSGQLVITVDGSDLIVRIMWLNTNKASSARVSLAAFQSASATMDFNLPALDHTGKSVQLTFRLRHNNNMAIAIDDRSIEVSMDELRQGLVRLGVLSDSQPEGIQTSATVVSRQFDFVDN